MSQKNNTDYREILVRVLTELEQTGDITLDGRSNDAVLARQLLESERFKEELLDQGVNINEFDQDELNRELRATLRILIDAYEAGERSELVAKKQRDADKKVRELWSEPLANFPGECKPEKK